MIRRFFFFIVPVLLAVQPLFGQLDVRKVDAGAVLPSSEGFFYSLPRTGFRVDIQVKRIQKLKGPYSEYADKYLGLSQVINVNSTEYELAAMQLSVFTEPDPDEYYFVQMTGKSKDRQEMELFLSNQGGLIGISAADEGTEGGKKGDLTSRSGVKIPEISNPSQFERVDTVIKRISVDTTTIEQKVFRKISAAKTTEQKAKEAADFILKLDESMFNLINGYQEVSYEKGTMEYMYTQMDNLKKEYLQLFKGVTGEDLETHSFTVYPDKSMLDSPVTLCKFSMSKGVTDITSSSGDLVLLELVSQDALRNIRRAVESRNNQHKDLKGVYYRIPEEALVTIKVGGRSAVESKFPVCQLGVVTFLPGTSFRNLELDNNTGGLRHVIVR